MIEDNIIVSNIPTYLYLISFPQKMRIFGMKKLLVFSSPDPKAQVSFSDQNVSVVRPRCRRRRRRPRC